MSGWTFLGNNTWSLSNQTLIPLAGNEGNSTIATVTVNTNSPPGQATITSSGTMTSPVIAQSVTRNVQVMLRSVKPFGYAVLARNMVDFNGNSATVDSWNSTDTGDYNTSNRRAHGNVATDGLVIDTGGLSLRGSPSTGPGGTWTGAAPIQPVSPDTGTNYFTADTQISIPDVKTPFVPASPVGASTVTTAGDYSFTSITANQKFGSATGAGGLIRVYVAGDINLGGNKTITIVQPTTFPHYTVQLYVAGSITFSGTVDINGGSGSRPADLQIYGLPTCTSVILNGTCETHASIYAPEAAATVNGGGNKAFYGSMVVSTFQANGAIDIHYDETLVNQGTVIGYKVARWLEF